MLKKITNTNNKRRLVSNFLSLIVLRGFQFLIPLLSLPYLIKVVGIENYGLLNFSQSLGLYFGAVIQFGFGITATREIARNRNDHVKVQSIYSQTLAASVILACVSFLIFLIILFNVDRFLQNSGLFVSTFFYICFQSLFPVWFFQGMQKMKFITLTTLGSNIFFLATLFIFVRDYDDFKYVSLLYMISAIVNFVVSILIIHRSFKVYFLLPTWQELKHTCCESFHAFVSQIGPTLFNNSSTFLLGLYSNNTILGLYTSATKVIDAGVSLANIISNTFLPYLSCNFDKHGFFQKIMFFTGLFLTIVVYMSSDLITHLIYGVYNYELVKYIQCLSIGIFLRFITITYGANYLMLIGKDHISKNITFYSSVLFFLIALATIPSVGVMAAISVSIGGRTLIALAQLFFYFKYSKVN